MSSERYYADVALQEGAYVTLSDNERHHLVHVMRTRPGEQVELVNGQGELAQAQLVQIDKSKVQLKIINVITAQLPVRTLILAQAFVRPNRLEVIIEKGTELGVTDFWLFPGEKSEKGEYSDNQLKRLHLLMIAAMKQCDRLDLPTITIKPPIKLWPPLNGLSFFGHLAPQAPALWQICSAPQAKSSSIMFVTGPESGFSEHEEEMLKNLGVQGVKLHTNILRTETASIVALALLSQCLLQ